MFFILYFFFSSFIFGLAILEFFQIVLHEFFKKVLALILGTIFNTLIIFLVSLFWKFNFSTTILTTSIVLFPSLIFLLFKKESFNIFDEVDIKKNLLPILIFFSISIFIILFFAKSIFQNSSGIIAGNRLVWTDWPVHIAIISSFSRGQNFPPQNPLYSGQLISYPFFSDFLSSVFQVLGADLKTSLIIPAIVLVISSLAMLYFFGKVITDKKTAIMGLIIGIFWGGLGFFYYFQDLLKFNFLETLKFPPHEYTFYGEKNLWFFSFIYSELLPQRSFLFGFPMFFIALTLFILGVARKKPLYFLISAIVIGIMPYFHMHAFVSVILLLSVFIPLNLFTTFINESFKEVKNQFLSLIFYFFLPILGLILIQAPFLFSIQLNQIIGLNWGWMKGQENFFIFWFKNTGFFWPLLIFALVKTKLNTITKNIIISSQVLFILPNILRFAPWPYDNLKIFTFWYLIGAFLVAKALISLFQKGILFKIAVILLFFSLIASGVIEDLRVLNTQKTEIPIWSKEDIDLAKTIVEKTEPTATILTAAVHDHPAADLAGRKIVIGFPGNAWSWGMPDWSQREIDVHNMFKADTFSTPYLIKKYNIDYVLISPRERNFEPLLNEEYFAQNGIFITGDENYKLYKIK